ncbi:MAG: hypothetical protein K0U41_04430, partial [Gammaproteobacteria bacterium]|nr:hypothetical protein [Gammaproteobacteria bacterium]
NDRAGYINRPLIIAPGLTGGLAQNQFNTNELYNHSIVIVMGLRRTSFDRDLYGCDELGATFSSCLPGYTELPQFNPRQTATDIIGVMKLLNSDALVSIEGVATSASSHFGTSEGFFNDVDVYTNSYGGTVVSYMAKELQDATDGGGTPPFTINRLVVDNGDGPNAKVISQGFAINLNRTNRLLDACAMNSFCNSNYKDDLDNLGVWMEEHHNTSITLNIDNNQTIENAIIYSSTLFTIWDEAWEQSTRSSNLTGPVIEILAGVAANASATNVTIDASSWTDDQFRKMIGIIIEVTIGMPPLLNEGYASNFIPLDMFLMFLNMQGQNATFTAITEETKREFISRIGLVCSSYITRTNDPDSRTFYEQQLMDPTLSPWRYGFLIIYRNILDLCAEEGVKNNLASPLLTAPANVQLEIAEGLIYYGGMDVKHSLESAIDIQSNFKDAELLVEDLRGQAGGPEGGDTAKAVFMEFFNSGSDTVNNELVNAANSRGLDRVFGP